MKLLNYFRVLLESYVFILLLSLTIGLLLPQYAILLAPYGTFFLGIIFFLSALKIDLKEFAKYLKDAKMVVAVNFMMLIGLPIIVYYATLLIYPDLAIAFLLLAAMPAGMTSPLLSEICGGKQSLALVLTISTSLLAPFTVPLMVGLLAGATVQVDTLGMFLSLVKVIFVPFILANIIKYFWHHKIKATYFTFKPISTVLLGLLIMGIVAKQAATILGGLNVTFLIEIAALFVLFAFFHVVGYYTVWWRKRDDRVTITICLTYLNFTLAIYLAGKFFNDPKIVVPVVLSVLPWSLLIIPFKYGMKKFK
ncbi:bile acid:sodium symporter [Candidatus Uhrbacteria bacterium]|nr:bile acid:sodium symporter [Candidatus Uhrbacteria bacterium]